MILPTHHKLKSFDPYFNAILRGDKRFEVRKNDRAFQKGDTVSFISVNKDGEQTGRKSSEYEIMFVLQGGQLGIEPGYCAFGINQKPFIQE